MKFYKPVYKDIQTGKHQIDDVSWSTKDLGYYNSKHKVGILQFVGVVEKEFNFISSKEINT